MKRKVWRSGNSLVITIPTELVEKLHLMEKKLIDFDIKDVFEETEKMFDNFFESNNVLEMKEPIKKLRDMNFRQPLADLKETDKEFIVNIEIPGTDKKDIQLNISDNVLEIKVEKRSEINVADEEKGYIRSEKIYNGFYRSLNLPSKVMPENARATYKNGILEVILPKVQEEKKNSNRIRIE